MAIGTRPLAQLCRRLGTGLRAGLDPIRLWQKERSRPGLRRYAEQILADLEHGETMANAIRRCRGFFPKQIAEMVEVGEETGRLAEVLLRLADELDHRLKVRRTFLTAITWPVFELVIALFVVGLFLLILQLVLPHANPFGPHAFRNYLLLVLLGVGITTAVIMAVLKGWLGGLLTRIFMRIPVIGPTLRAGNMARLTWTLAAALDAGVDARRAVRMALESTQNDWYSQQKDVAMAAIEQGKTFYEAFDQTRAFDDEFLGALSAAELSGTYAESLRRLAQEYQDEFERRTTLLAQFAGFAVWILIAMIIIGFIFFIVVNVILTPYKEAIDFLENG